MSAILVLAAAAVADGPPMRFVDVTDEAGLGGLWAARITLADLNANGRADAVIDRHRIFLNTPDAEAPLGFRFIEVEGAGLPLPQRGDSVVFADLDNDGFLDAIVVRYLDVNREEFEPPAEAPAQTAWLKGNGDGTFGPPQIISAAQQATTVGVAVGDVNRDGRLDLYLGNWYTEYGRSLESFTNDLLIQSGEEGRVEFSRQQLGEDGHDFDVDDDAAGRPTYGTMIADVMLAERSPTGVRVPQLLELNYGRRANRLWMDADWSLRDGPAGRDVAPMVHFDGDDIRHGRHPEWLKIIAERDARFARPDEKPFRSHGNTFDVAVGDVNNNGRFDLFLAEITHAWAGDSSDRSRLLMAMPQDGEATVRFEPSPHSFDRIPPTPPRDDWPEGWFPRWNQGDLFCDFADLDNDGLLDVIISSGDYPDPPPYDQRLRIFRQLDDGSFKDVTAASGIDHVGSQQISLGDVTGDGQIDILVGQSFTRFTREMREAAGGEPRVRLFVNRTHASANEQRVENSITLRLIGDPDLAVNRDALGAIVQLWSNVPGREKQQTRQLIGIGGHAGKQRQFLVHFGLGAAEHAERIEIHWPATQRMVTTLTDVPAGHHVIRLRDDRNPE